MSAKIIQTDKAPAAIGPYSQAIVMGDFVFVAGQVGIDPAAGKMVEGGVEAQARQIMSNLRAILTEAGSSFDRVVKTTVFLADMADFPRMNEVYARAFGPTRPARSTVQAAGLPRGVLVEIEAIAALR